MEGKGLILSLYTDEGAIAQSKCCSAEGRVPAANFQKWLHKYFTFHIQDQYNLIYA